MLKEVTRDSDIITPIKHIKGAIQVQTLLTWTLAFTGLLVILMNAGQLPQWAPARGAPGRPRAMHPPAPQSRLCSRADFQWASVGACRHSAIYLIRQAARAGAAA